MGKPSKASRKKDIIRLQQRQKLKKFSYVKQIKKKEEEIGDLQIELQKLNKFIDEAGEKVINEFTKSDHEKKNLLKWIDLYTEQIKDMEKKLYLNDLNLYINTSQPPPALQQQQPQPSQSQPFFTSLDEYFKYEKEQKEQGKFLLFYL